MKKHLIICLLGLIPLLGKGQTYYSAPVSGLETDFGGRLSATADKRLAKGLHLTLDGEVRFKNDFSTLGRWQVGAGLTYKINPYLKVGAGYEFIEKMNSSGSWIPRHRLYADARGGIAAGDWRFSLRERLQYTYRNPESMNVYQNNPNLFALKSRLKVEYKGFRSISPYASVEARITLNDPACTASWDGTSFSDYSFTGYTDAHFSRLRSIVGLEWKLSKTHSLDFSLLGDYNYEKSIDTNAEGTKLKSLSYDRSFNAHLCIGYKFSF